MVNAGKVKAGDVVQLNFRSGKENADKKGGTWQPDRKLRGDSRRNYKNGLQRSMWCYKTVTNDKVFMATQNNDSKLIEAWATDIDFADTVRNDSGNGESVVGPVPPTEVEPPEEEPTVFDLARLSPAKGCSKPTARTARADREKSCAKCRVKHGSWVDLKIDSPWIGCDGVDKGEQCSYWAHACCMGFTNARDGDFCEEKKWFCDDHNKMKQTIENWKESQKVSSKRRVNKRR